MLRLRSLMLVNAIAFALAGCGGGADEPGAEAPASPPPAAPPAAAPPPASAAPDLSGVTLPAGVTAEMVSAGAAAFPTQVCSACHGPNAQGMTGLGPNLADAEWLNSDGGFDGIVGTITNGVPTPRQAAAPMPPKGGVATITDQQVRELAAYVFALSRPR